ncbi:MAG TPA: calcium-binding protein [Allosphingosinicella sp.]
MARTQCEAEKMVGATASKLTNISIALGTGALVTSIIPGGQLASAVLSGASFAVGVWAKAGSDQQASLREGCRLEEQQSIQNPNNHSGTAGAGEASYRPPEAGRGLHCGEIYVPGPPAYGNWQDGFTINGGRFVTVCSPIALDLDGDGIEYISLNSPVLIDIHGSGRSELSAWLGPDDGLLIYDENGDGIGQHNEAVLTSFVHDARTDLEALHAFDSNRDGVLNAADTYFVKMKIGRDLNQNGKFESNEVKTLAEHGIAAINLSAGVQQVSSPDDPAETLRGVFTFNSGQFVRSNGGVGGFADVALQSVPYHQHVYSDGIVSITTYGTMHLWVQTSAAGVALDLSTASYAGYSNFVDFVGNSGNDYAVGTSAANLLVGGDGADTLLGQGGDDIIVSDYADFAGATVQGGVGQDTLIYTSAQAIYLDVAAYSFEIVQGGSGSDTLYTSSGTLGAAGVILAGNEGNDYLGGSDGNDYFAGGAGADTYSGGHGEDVFLVDATDSWTAINGGYNTLGYGDIVMVEDTTGFYFGNMTQQQVEHFFGGAGNDTAYASRTDNYYYLEPGSNRMGGGAGNDYLYGGAGNDYYFWERGGGYDVFVDRDYGEIKGDVVSLGEGITAADVTLSLSGSTLYVFIAGTGGGQITLSGFAALYGPHDMLFVDDKFYDLNNFVTSYVGPVSVASLYPIPPSGSGGSSGGGGTGGGGVVKPGGGGSIPPLILDLDGDGFELIAAKKSGIYFDWNGDGIREQTGWVGSGDGILVFDRNGDGDITADEIAFGRIYGKKDGFVSDLDGLRAFDTNANGSLDEGDADFARFGVWKDADSDAVVDAGELSGLQDIGLLALSLTGFQTGEDIKEGRNTLYATTDAVFADGTTIKAGDVFLGYSDNIGGSHGFARSIDILMPGEAFVHIA